jgi:serine/threonine-protein kinase SRPK3
VENGKQADMEYGSYGELVDRRPLQGHIIDGTWQVFELITGDYLFDPQSGTKYGKDDDHIAQIIELLGPFINPMPFRQVVSRNLQPQGELRNIHRLRHWALPDVLREKYHFSVEESKRLQSFDPDVGVVAGEEANAGRMSGSPFLEGTKDGWCEFADSVGSRGEGIDGWATEVKKR